MNEAVDMARPPLDLNATQDAKASATFPKTLISTGTGRPDEHTRFGVWSLISFIVANFVNTKGPHQEMQRRQEEEEKRGTGFRYFRFDVPNEHGQPDLAKIKLSECKKNHITPWHTRTASRLRRGDAGRTGLVDGGPDVDTTRLQVVTREDNQWQRQAAQKDKGGFKPIKYRYQTFDDIRERTLGYCERDENIIKDCAAILFNQSKARRQNNRKRWQEFRDHPDPCHSSNMGSQGHSSESLDR
ncbi:hypothetical protein F4825DRAFT_439502 [Nemania diffusa]|nr:hypothetical protein F4825DRAFT_439502 [Nemania diffusa]